MFDDQSEIDHHLCHCQNQQQQRYHPQQNHHLHQQSNRSRNHRQKHLKQWNSFGSILFLIVIGAILITDQYCEAKNLSSQGTAFLTPSNKCNKTEVDQTVRWLYFFDDPDRMAPDDSESFKEFCNQSNQKEVSVKEYARKCLAKFPRQITSLLMFGIIRKNRQLCSKIKLRNEMIHAAKCLNAIKSKGSKCFNRGIQEFLMVKHMPLKDRVGRMCCVYYQLEECLVHQATETPTSCSAKDASMIENLIEGYTGQVVANTCQNFPKSHDHCTKLLPKREMNKLKKLVATELTRTYSILPPLIDILDSIPP